jgi:KUP system potassium uptake protein
MSPRRWPMRKAGLKFDIMSTSFYLGRRKLVAGPGMGMPHWQDRLFIALAEAATDPSDYFRLPARTASSNSARTS